MSGQRILVVDDETALVDMIKIRLERSGYEVLTAYDGQEALDVARAQKPDLMVLDLMMPKIDGYQVCRLLKFDKNTKHIPIVMLTARSQESDKESGKEVGADAYILKPFEPEQLLKEIVSLLSDS